MNIRLCSIGVLVLLAAGTATVPPAAADPSAATDPPAAADPPTAAVPPTASPQSGVPIQTSAPNQPQQVVIQTPTVAVASDAETAFKSLEIEAHNAGYRTQVHDGKRYFCRTEIPTGSHVRVNDCLVPEALERLLTAQSQAKSKLERSTGCGNDTTCNGKPMR
jgi:hypothetical protein